MENKHFDNKDPQRLFKVPEDYFASLERRVLTSIEATPAKSIPVIPLYRRRSIWGAAAAVALILLGSSLFISKDTTNLSDDNIESYLEYNQIYTLNNEIINALDEEDLNEIKNNIDIKQTQLDHYVLSHIDLEYYLND